MNGEIVVDDQNAESDGVACADRSGGSDDNRTDDGAISSERTVGYHCGAGVAVHGLEIKRANTLFDQSAVPTTRLQRLADDGDVKSVIIEDKAIAQDHAGNLKKVATVRDGLKDAAVEISDGGGGRIVRQQNGCLDETAVENQRATGRRILAEDNALAVENLAAVDDQSTRAAGRAHEEVVGSTEWPKRTTPVNHRAAVNDQCACGIGRIADGQNIVTHGQCAARHDQHGRAAGGVADPGLHSRNNHGTAVGEYGGARIENILNGKGRAVIEAIAAPDHPCSGAVFGNGDAAAAMILDGAVPGATGAGAESQQQIDTAVVVKSTGACQFGHGLVKSGQFERAARADDQIGVGRNGGRAPDLQGSVAHNCVAGVAVVGEVEDGRAGAQFLQTGRAGDRSISAERVALGVIAYGHARGNDVGVQQDGAAADVIEGHGIAGDDNLMIGGWSWANQPVGGRVDVPYVRGCCIGAGPDQTGTRAGDDRIQSGIRNIVGHETSRALRQDQIGNVAGASDSASVFDESNRADVNGSETDAIGAIKGQDSAVHRCDIGIIGSSSGQAESCAGAAGSAGKGEVTEARGGAAELIDREYGRVADNRAALESRSGGHLQCARIDGHCAGVSTGAVQEQCSRKIRDGTGEGVHAGEGQCADTFLGQTSIQTTREQWLRTGDVVGGGINDSAACQNVGLLEAEHPGIRRIERGLQSAAIEVEDGVCSRAGGDVECQQRAAVEVVGAE